VAFGKARGSKPSAAQDTMSGNGFFGVNGAGRVKPALIAKPGAQQVAIGTYKGQNYGLHTL